MRLAAYAGVSIALTGAAILRAFHERPNFYSASVYLAQSNACRMILLNFLLFCVGSFIFGLQRLLYGSLRPIEIEQLWDKAWYAITETALAMTTFREEIGVWFIVMFATLLAGKVWSWIAEGRVEVLDQQPPNNPRMFHTRLLASLLLSEFFAFYMLRYCVRTLIDEPKPGMMVMFAFEFAVLSITSTSTTLRYGVSLYETFVIRQQTIARIEERKREILAARAAAQQTEADTSTSPDSSEDEIDESEIDVPGWQDKGRFVFYLELFTDFLKLTVYLGFFTILFAFNGIPLHIIRDVYFTMRSFIKRILDFVKYRKATRDMNARYPDATIDELERDGTCIICRDDMRPWQQTGDVDNAAGGQRTQLPTDERQRPKKLPCGHILHFGCLRSWLERQQVCPTCRRSVLAPPIDRSQRTGTVQPPRDANPGNNPVQVRHPQHPQPHNDNHRPARDPVRARTFNLGPIRITFAAGNGQQIRQALQQARDQPQRNVQAHNRNGILSSIFRALGFGGNVGLNPDTYHHVEDRRTSLSEQLRNIEHRINEELASLNLVQGQLAAVRALQVELARLRTIQTQTVPPQPSGEHPTSLASASLNGLAYQNPGVAPAFQPFALPTWQPRLRSDGQAMIANHQTLTTNLQRSSMLSGDPQLPQGLTLPDGWSLMPLQRLSDIQHQPPIAQPNGTSLPNGSIRAANGDQSVAGPPRASNHEPTAASNAPVPGNSQEDSSATKTDRVSDQQANTHETSRGDVPGLAPDSTIPSWGSSSLAEVRMEEQDSHQPNNEPAHTMIANGHGEGRNGKSRAATVEDVTE